MSIAALLAIEVIIGFSYRPDARYSRQMRKVVAPSQPCIVMQDEPADGRADGVAE